MLEGRCPGCGSHYYGWALVVASQQACPRCGSRLEIYERETDRLITRGNSVFEDYENIIRPSADQSRTTRHHRPEVPPNF